MTTDRTTTLLASLLLAAALAAPRRSLAQAKPTAAQLEALNAQEKELLAVAQDFSRRVAETMEGWLAAKEVTRGAALLLPLLPDAQDRSAQVHHRLGSSCRTATSRGSRRRS